MDKSSLYHTAHLIVAAVRVLDHQKGVPPSVTEVSRTLSLSAEEVHAACNMLEKKGVLQIVESAAGQRLYVSDPKPLEKLPREKQRSDMEKELKRFASEKKAQMTRLASRATSEVKRRKDLFADLDAKLKKRLKKNEK